MNKTIELTFKIKLSIYILSENIKIKDIYFWIPSRQTVLHYYVWTQKYWSNFRRIFLGTRCLITLSRKTQNLHAPIESKNVADLGNATWQLIWIKSKLKPSDFSFNSHACEWSLWSLWAVKSIMFETLPKSTEYFLISFWIWFFHLLLKTNFLKIPCLEKMLSQHRFELLNMTLN